MARTEHPLFDIAGDFSARKSFKFQNHSYAKGQSFPWRAIACSQRKLRLLYDGGFIMLPAPVVEPAKEDNQSEFTYKPKKTKKPKKAKKTYYAEDISTDEDIKEFVSDQE